MSGTAALAAEELKRFAGSFRNVIALADMLASMGDPDSLQASIARLKQDSAQLIATYRAEAEAEARRNMAAQVQAAELKAKGLVDAANSERDAILASATLEANRLVAEAQQRHDELIAKTRAAHQAAQEAMR